MEHSIEDERFEKMEQRLTILNSNLNLVKEGFIIHTREMTQSMDAFLSKVDQTITSLETKIDDKFLALRTHCGHLQNSVSLLSRRLTSVENRLNQGLTISPTPAPAFIPIPNHNNWGHHTTSTTRWGNSVSSPTPVPPPPDNSFSSTAPPLSSFSTPSPFIRPQDLRHNWETTSPPSDFDDDDL
jgi:hypothetical protein